MLRRTARLLALALPAAVASACGADDPGYQYPLDDVLRLNQLQVKGSHNSYHIDPGIHFDPWAYTHVPLDEQLDRQDVRQIELDLHYFDTDGPPYIAVYHVPLDTHSTCRLLTDCLGAVASWTRRHPLHEPILVLLEPKEDFDAGRAEAFLAKIEADILASVPRERVLTPDDVKGDAPSLHEAIVTRGWPTLGQTRGRVMFVLLDSHEHRDVLTHGGMDLDGRLLFALGGSTEPFASTLLIDNAPANEEAIRAAVEQGFLVRTRADVDGVEARANDRTRIEAALRSGAQFISTDFPEPYPPTGYSFEIPGGTPARCNPITAPAGCTAEAIEDPAHLD